MIAPRRGTIFGTDLPCPVQANITGKKCCLALPEACHRNDSRSQSNRCRTNHHQAPAWFRQPIANQPPGFRFVADLPLEPPFRIGPGREGLRRIGDLVFLFQPFLGFGNGKHRSERSRAQPQISADEEIISILICVDLRASAVNPKSFQPDKYSAANQAQGFVRSGRQALIRIWAGQLFLPPFF
jgi:hypothetical protein